ncbi:hypothetical protein NFI96_002605 [Xyrichtys novacula]|uniref:Uncharacterized protein n=1 Tax=Xyrichtys novacula TaxID=13765 RepID=A0AAV1GDP9_XYRNO|nr:hypothetical protein NFI96_002605 [Xyrichtys novacula]
MASDPCSSDPDQLCGITAHLYTVSLKLGKVQQLCKTSCVVPVPKIFHTKTSTTTGLKGRVIFLNIIQVSGAFLTASDFLAAPLPCQSICLSRSLFLSVCLFSLQRWGCSAADCWR